MDSSDFLVMRGIRKNYDGTQALKGVDFSARLGEVHAIVGENGAGKSTLMKVLSGALQKDGGEILLDGSPVVIRSPAGAEKLTVDRYDAIRALQQSAQPEGSFLLPVEGAPLIPERLGAQPVPAAPATTPPIKEN